MRQKIFLQQVLLNVFDSRYSSFSIVRNCLWFNIVHCWDEELWSSWWHDETRQRLATTQIDEMPVFLQNNRTWLLNFLKNTKRFRELFVKSSCLVKYVKLRPHESSPSGILLKKLLEQRILMFAFSISICQRCNSRSFRNRSATTSTSPFRSLK